MDQLWTRIFKHCIRLNQTAEGIIEISIDTFGNIRSPLESLRFSGRDSFDKFFRLESGQEKALPPLLPWTLHPDNEGRTSMRIGIGPNGQHAQFKLRSKDGSIRSSFVAPGVNKVETDNGTVKASGQDGTLTIDARTILMVDRNVNSITVVPAPCSYIPQFQRIRGVIETLIKILEEFVNTVMIALYPGQSDKLFDRLKPANIKTLMMSVPWGEEHKGFKAEIMQMYICSLVGCIGILTQVAESFYATPLEDPKLKGHKVILALPVPKLKITRDEVANESGVKAFQISLA